MATSIVAKTMVALLSFVWCMAALTGAQSVQPSNATLPVKTTKSETQLTLKGAAFFSFNLAPLTVKAGLGSSPTGVGVCRYPQSDPTWNTTANIFLGC